MARSGWRQAVAEWLAGVVPAPEKPSPPSEVDDLETRIARYRMRRRTEPTPGQQAAELERQIQADARRQRDEFLDKMAKQIARRGYYWPGDE